MCVSAVYICCKLFAYLKYRMKRQQQQHYMKIMQQKHKGAGSFVFSFSFLSSSINSMRIKIHQVQSNFFHFHLSFFFYSFFCVHFSLCASKTHFQWWNQRNEKEKKIVVHCSPLSNFKLNQTMKAFFLQPCTL